ncbi:terminase small subunit [Spirosoma radiotolerans]|uniref:terminase small subunit n=1 Tax=Spirosoma radiotolerans TaxID=1379870 RepID=UPI0006965EC1|nr:terminase small subunit [Spirosoma radiotolerans]
MEDQTASTDGQEETTVPAWYDGLTDKQRRFVEEYCIDFNATRAAKTAGYSDKTAQEQGSRLLSNVMVRKAIDDYLDSLSMTSAEAIYRLTSMGRGSIAPFVEPYGRGLKFDFNTEEAKANMHLIKKITNGKDGMSFELHDPKDAIFKIMQLRGKVVSKHEHTGANGGPIKTDSKQQSTVYIVDTTEGHKVPAPDDDYSNPDAQ